MKRKKIGALLLLPLALASCNARPSLDVVEKHKAEVKASLPTTPPDKTTFTATITGRYTVIWDSKVAGDSVVAGSLSADVNLGQDDYENGPSAMLLVPSIITPENFDEVYELMDEYFTPPNLRGIYVDVNLVKDGGFTFAVYDVNVQMFVYGLQGEGMEASNPVSTKGRWNVEIGYDKTGVIAWEKTWTANSHTNDPAGTAEVECTYQTA